MEFFAADHHFGHNNIIKFCNRPVIDMNSMIEMLVAKHNEKVTNDDKRILHRGYVLAHSGL